MKLTALDFYRSSAKDNVVLSVGELKEKEICDLPERVVKAFRQFKNDEVVNNTSLLDAVLNPEISINLYNILLFYGVTKKTMYDTNALFNLAENYKKLVEAGLKYKEFIRLKKENSCY